MYIMPYYFLGFIFFLQTLFSKIIERNSAKLCDMFGSRTEFKNIRPEFGCYPHCAQLQYTVQHRTVPIISHLTSRQPSHLDEQFVQFLDWVSSHWAHVTVPRFIYVYVCVFVCVYLVILHVCCIIVTWWDEPSGTEA